MEGSPGGRDPRRVVAESVVRAEPDPVFEPRVPLRPALGQDPVERPLEAAGGAPAVRPPVLEPDGARIVAVHGGDDEVHSGVVAVPGDRPIPQEAFGRIAGVVLLQPAVDLPVGVEEPPHDAEPGALGVRVLAGAGDGPVSDEALHVPLVRIEEESHQRLFIVRVPPRVGLDDHAQAGRGREGVGSPARPLGARLRERREGRRDDERRRRRVRNPHIGTLRRFRAGLPAGEGRTGPAYHGAAAPHPSPTSRPPFSHRRGPCRRASGGANIGKFSGPRRLVMNPRPGAARRASREGPGAAERLPGEFARDAGPTRPSPSHPPERRENDLPCPSEPTSRRS